MRGDMLCGRFLWETGMKKGIFNRMVVQRQMFSRILLICFVPVILSGALLITKSTKRLYNHDGDMLEQENIRVRSIVLDLSMNLEAIARSFVLDDQMTEVLTQQYPDRAACRRKLDSFHELTSAMDNQPSISDIEVYTNNGTISYPDFTFLSGKLCQTRWYKTLTVTRNLMWVTSKAPAGSLSDYQLALYCYLPLPLQNDFAILKITVSENYLRNRLQNAYMPTAIRIQSKHCFYNEGQVTETSLPFLKSDAQASSKNRMGRGRIGDQTCFLYQSELSPDSDDNAFCILTYSTQACSEFAQQTAMYVTLFLLTLLIPGVLLYMYTAYFSSRISILRDAMRKASHGDYDIIARSRGNDELSETFRDMKMLIDHTKANEKKIYQALLREQALINQKQLLENQQQKMELRVLASQMNPHFLYNTLESIRMRAILNDDRDTAEAIQLLGQYFHYALESVSRPETTLEHELCYMQLYLRIQKFRFKDRVNYSVTTGQDLQPEKVVVPVFLLQPVVENAVIHGLKDVVEAGLVAVSVKKEAKELMIRIRDNGCGIGPEKLASLNEQLRKGGPATKHIGLTNIATRIRLLYGKNYGLFVESTSDEGTLVTIRLPYKEQ
jgi:two-component system sensor histidine kinase YesM